MTTQRELALVKQRLQQYKEEIAQLKEQTQQAQATATIWEEKFTSHMDEREAAHSAFIANKEHQIVILQQELLQAHKHFADKLLEFSSKDRDRLMTEKLK